MAEGLPAGGIKGGRIIPSMHLESSTEPNGAHAAFFTALFPDSPRRCVGPVGAPEDDDSFPLTDGDILPAARMFFAALTSRS